MKGLLAISQQKLKVHNYLVIYLAKYIIGYLSDENTETLHDDVESQASLKRRQVTAFLKHSKMSGVSRHAKLKCLS